MLAPTLEDFMADRYSVCAAMNSRAPLTQVSPNDFVVTDPGLGEQYAWQMMWIVVAEMLLAVRIDSATPQHPDGRPLATIIPGAVHAAPFRDGRLYLPEHNAAQKPTDTCQIVDTVADTLNEIGERQ